MNCHRVKMAVTMAPGRRSCPMNPHDVLSTECVPIVRTTAGVKPALSGTRQPRCPRSCRRFSRACDPRNLHAPPNTHPTTRPTLNERPAKKTDLNQAPWISSIMAKTSDGVWWALPLHARPPHQREDPPRTAPRWLRGNQQHSKWTWNRLRWCSTDLRGTRQGLCCQGS